MAALAEKKVESLADLQREFDRQNGVTVGCAAVLERFLAHAAQLAGGKPISTRRVAMCAGPIIDDLVAALPTCASIAEVFRDGIAFLLASARRAHPKADRKVGGLRSGLVGVGARPQSDRL
jgi:hypothetical protein